MAIRTILAVFTALAALFHLRLSCAPSDENVREQLAFVRRELEAGSAARMQALFPEGALFNYALYALASIDRGDSNVRFAIDALDSADARAPFDPALRPAYGVFYVGWSSVVRGRYLELLAARGEADTAVRARFERDCAALADAFATQTFLEAYPGQAWPVDSVVAMAALAIHDRVYAPKYEHTRAEFIASLPRDELLPHQIAPMTVPARGSSQSIIARFLPLVDETFARDHYRRFRERFVTTVLGVPGVREYPLGVHGEGDVDSGPLIFGISASATVVTLGAARAVGDHALAGALARVCEAFGAPFTWRGERRFGFGLLPVGDAFIAWARAAPIHEDAGTDPIAESLWPLRAVTLLAFALVWRVSRRKRGD